MNNVPISIPEAAVNAVLGYAVVFFGLILLMCVITIMGKVMAGKRDANAPAAPAPPAPAKVETPAAPSAPPAPGTAGELKLYGTDPKTAAIIMAITADKLGTPLNELRFQSIKEVKKK